MAVHGVCPDEVERNHLSGHCPGNGRAAAAIGISRAAFYKKLVAHRAAGRMAPGGVAED